MNRNDALTAIRPVLPLDTNDNLEPETFQTDVVRPILELQYDAIVLVFEAARDRYPAEVEFREVFENQTLQDQLLGIVIGMLTEDELLFYLAHQSSLNPIILSMILRQLEDLIESTSSSSS